MDMLFTGTNGRPTRFWGKLGEGFFRVNDTFFFLIQHGLYPLLPL
jgi:hypothetical protein